jgi:hypothetical protein
MRPFTKTIKECPIHRLSGSFIGSIVFVNFRLCGDNSFVFLATNKLQIFTASFSNPPGLSLTSRMMRSAPSFWVVLVLLWFQKRLFLLKWDNVTRLSSIFAKKRYRFNFYFINTICGIRFALSEVFYCNFCVLEPLSNCEASSLKSDKSITYLNDLITCFKPFVCWEIFIRFFDNQFVFFAGEYSAYAVYSPVLLILNSQHPAR